MNTLTAISPVVNASFLEITPAYPGAAEIEEHRPTIGPDFLPTLEEDEEAAGLLNGDDEPPDSYWDAMAEESMAMDLACSGLRF